MLSIFRNRKKESRHPVRLEVDLHSHLLPGIDDGAETMDQSLQLIQSLRELGYRKAVTTPHIIKGVYNNKANIIQAKLRELLLALSKNHIPFTVLAAAEHYFDEDFFNGVEDRSLLEFGNRFVLFELPFSNQPPMVEAILFRLALAGYQPILAHPERYAYFEDRHLDRYKTLKDQGVLMQLNIMSLTGHYGTAIRDRAFALIRENLIDFAGTDLHRMQQIPVLTAALHHPIMHQLASSGFLKNQLL